jgi:ABC-type Fe3+-siderophore transport system permease subunit
MAVLVFLSLLYLPLTFGLQRSGNAEKRGAAKGLGVERGKMALLGMFLLFRHCVGMLHSFVGIGQFYRAHRPASVKRSSGATTRLLAPASALAGALCSFERHCGKARGGAMILPIGAITSFLARAALFLYLLLKGGTARDRGSRTFRFLSGRPGKIKAVEFSDDGGECTAILGQ